MSQRGRNDRKAWERAFVIPNRPKETAATGGTVDIEPADSQTVFLTNLPVAPESPVVTEATDEKEGTDDA